ncbi:hypothetical protein QJS10_CPB12g00060 [Acorus calamus]|uniref:RING-type domain-containing protein n=1 Tax=Acorus calamus TaxID=4465 RepID=A0AAV9DKE8_ACOCL|nr:hypothetical protein QJS10_CPB12g00066 [Acorus calamus]KAK1301358.1 hypothetical protein QJS10_CPB12g00060 [Acorus calamus]
MGGVCCVAAREKTLVNRTRSLPSSTHVVEATHRRQARYSPSWSFRWDSRTHVEGVADDLVQLPQIDSGCIESEIKTGGDTENEGLSDGGSLLDLQTPSWQKSPVSEGTPGNSAAGTLDLSFQSNCSTEENDFMKSSDIAAKDTVSTPTSTPSAISKAAVAFTFCPSSRSRSLPTWKSRSPSHHHFSRQSSDSRTPSSKSPNECGSSDGWSTRAFSELVAASSSGRDERWSAEIDGAHTDAKACGVCSKPLRNKSPWGAQKIMAGTNNELSVVAVLACGHVYHAECLEHATPEADRFDPPCMMCRVGEQPSSSKPKRVESEAKSRNKMSRIGAVDADSEAGDEMAVESGRWKGKGPKMGASFSVRRPFLRRHFSVGSRSARPELEGGGDSGDEPRRKGFFWGWNRRV